MEVNGGEKYLGEFHMDQDVTAVLANVPPKFKRKKEKHVKVCFTYTYKCLVFPKLSKKDPCQT